MKTMAPINFNNKLIVSSINNNYKFLFFGLILIIYFAWMDIALFINLQKWSPPPLNDLKQSESSNSKFSNLNPEYLDSLNSNNITVSNKINYNNLEKKLAMIYIVIPMLTLFLCSNLYLLN